MSLTCWAEVATPFRLFRLVTGKTSQTLARHGRLKLYIHANAQVQCMTGAFASASMPLNSGSTTLLVQCIAA